MFGFPSLGTPVEPLWPKGGRWERRKPVGLS